MSGFGLVFQSFFNRFSMFFMALTFNFLRIGLSYTVYYTAGCWPESSPHAVRREPQPHRASGL